MEILNTGSLSKLTFFNVSDTDYGNYTCVAINKLGSSNTSFLLYGKKQLVLRLPQTANDTFSTEKPTIETHTVYVLVIFYEVSTSVCLQFTKFCSQCINSTKKNLQNGVPIISAPPENCPSLWFWTFRELESGSARWLLMRHIKSDLVKLPRGIDFIFLLLSGFISRNAENLLISRQVCEALCS